MRDDVIKSLQSVQNKYDWLKSPKDSNGANFADTILWDSLQSSFGCCGVTGAQDWDSLRPPGEPAAAAAMSSPEASPTSDGASSANLPPSLDSQPTPTSDFNNQSISSGNNNNLPSASPLVAAFYPRSCCDSPSIALKGYEQAMCSAQDTYTIGCHLVLRHLWKWALVIPGILAAGHLLVALVAHLIRLQIKSERLADDTADPEAGISPVGASVAMQAY